MGLVLVSCSELAFEGSGVNAEAIAWPWVWVWATSCNICKHCKLRDASSIWSKFWRLTWKTQPLFDFGSVHLCTSLYISALGSSWKFPSVFFRFPIRFLWLWASDLTQMGYNSPIQCLSPISPSHPTHPTHTSHSVETWNSDWDFFAMSYPFLSFPIISVSNLSPICLKTTRAEEHDEGWFLRWFFLRGDKPSFLREKLQLALEPHATSTVSRHSKPNQTQVAPPKPNHETKPPHESHDLRVVFGEKTRPFCDLPGTSSGPAKPGREGRKGREAQLSLYVAIFLSFYMILYDWIIDYIIKSIQSIL